MGLLRRKRVKTIEVANVDEIRQETYFGKKSTLFFVVTLVVGGPLCLIWVAFPQDKRIVVQQTPVIQNVVVQEAPEVIEARVL